MSKSKKSKLPVPTVDSPYFFVDTHCHLDMDAYNSDIVTILTTAQDYRVKSIITIGIDEESSLAAVDLARKHPMVKATIGIHPHDAEQIQTNTYQNLKNLAAANDDYIVGYGEIGLDYAKNYSDPAIQRKVFTEQLEIAKELKLPVIIHDRDAHDDTLQILRTAGPFPNGGVMHCFSGDNTLASKVLDLGFHISIPGIVTFKNGIDLQKVAAFIPSDSLLLETDGPFLAPVPWRGKRNTPSYLLYTAFQVAKLRDISIEELAEQTSNNALTLFNYNIEQ